MFTENSIRTDYIGQIEYETFLKDVQLFLLFRNFRYKLSSKTSLQEKDLNLNEIYKRFNDSEAHYWEIGKIYHLGNRRVFPCVSKASKKLLYLKYVFNY